ncbi:hypothetical protein PAXRUDRAFT_114326, partial [Paxillus rubicundulus Ve08.2h10]
PNSQECILQLDVWSVHQFVQFHTWLDKHYPWIKDCFVPGGCTGIAHPCNVGIQCQFKLAAKWVQHTNIIEESLEFLQ